MHWPPPPGMSIPGGACHTSSPPLPPPQFSVIFQLGWVPFGKNISIQNVVALYYYAKDNFFEGGIFERVMCFFNLAKKMVS